MYGFNIAEAGHVVPMLHPVDINGGKNSDVVSMANHAHIDIIVDLGVTGGATTVTVEECDDFAASNSTAIAFDIYKEETASGDTLATRVAATSSGVALSTNDGVYYVIPIDANQLSAGYPNLRVVLSDPSGETFGTVLGVLSGSRYAKDANATAIA